MGKGYFLRVAKTIKYLRGNSTKRNHMIKTIRSEEKGRHTMKINV
jgi:hypothetical protein